VEVDLLRGYRASGARAATPEELRCLEGRPRTAVGAITAVESGGVPRLQAASTTAELTGGAARAVEDNLVLAVVVDVDKVALPTSRARV
jgi:hypothetical protein